MNPGQQSLFPDMDGTQFGNGRRRALILPKLLARAARDVRLQTDAQRQSHDILVRWADLETGGKLLRRKEKTLHGEFLADVFGKALGYTFFSENLPQWQIEPEFGVPGGEADAAIGFFSGEQREPPRALVELKGPRVNLDRDRFNGRTAVQQCWDYLYAVPECPWGIVSNFVSFRLYHRNKTPQAYVLFTLQELRDPQRFREFYYLFDRGGLLPMLEGQRARADELLEQSDNRQREVGRELYEDYHQNRLALINHLRKRPHSKPLDKAIQITQKLLDRIVFVAFCEDRRLLPAKSIEKAWTQEQPFAKVRNPKWRNFLGLFRSIDTGNERFGINAYNGGLFKDDREVDGLELDDRWTDFFKEISSYDFQDEVNVDVLGRLFERSVTDLEALKADPDGELRPLGRRPSGRRRREGIYYTPPHVTSYIVEHTIGTCLTERFAELAKQHGIDPGAEPDKRTLANWVKYQQARLAVLRNLRVVDPACGSGAFLIQAFEYLEGVYDEVVDALCLHQGQDDLKLRDGINATILRDNLFGVDLSAEAVEITQLALWIRTAERGKSLADLSGNIRCGNSVVNDPKVDPRAFDWTTAFGDQVPGGQFDCVISNPPYVKLQTFRKREPAVAEFLVEHYRSAQTGNFDMYLPFIERGLELLKPGGRMGFIAPNVWLFNEYGQGLRELIAEARSLERFVDFKSHQVFEDATTYTALQFFSGTRRRTVAAADAGTGDVANLEFYNVPYTSLGKGAWALLPKRDQNILDKMRSGSVTLAEASSSIIVGIQTSADAVYHLIKLGPGCYFSKALNGEVQLEDDIMKPLVSGEEAVPFATPPTDKYLLFPYLVTDTECRLRTAPELQKHFRRAWDYLRRNEKTLRRRESGKMEHDRWYAYVYPKNIDKQHLRKLLVPRLLFRLFAAVDSNGQMCLDNVDVGGVLPKKGWGLYYILGVLNSSPCDFAWRATSKPFRGEYRSANKQFIAPLPVPKTKSQAPVAKLARRLADLHGRRLSTLSQVRRRFTTDLPPAQLVQTSPLPPKLPRKIEDFDELPLGELLPALEKFAKRRFKPKEREDWDEYVSAGQTGLAQVKRRIADAEAELDERVARLYGLTTDDMKAIGELAL